MKFSNPTDVKNQLVELPPTIKTHYSNISLAADVLHVTNVPFLTSTFNRMHSGTVNLVDNMKIITLYQGKNH